MKLYIACPSHSGSVTCAFMASYTNTLMGLQKDGIDHQLNLHEGESAIGRGRNHLAMDFLESGYDKLLFIDTDLIWTYEDLKRLLVSDKKLIAGTYPLKGYPIVLNFNPHPEQRKELFSVDYSQDYLDMYKTWVKTHANHRGEVDVLHVPTGFMLIDRELLIECAKNVPEYFEHDARTRVTRRYFDLFQMIVKDGEYQTEDWFICSLARKLGHKVYLQTESICTHTGVHHYSFGQHIIMGQKPIIRT